MEFTLICSNRRASWWASFKSFKNGLNRLRLSIVLTVALICWSTVGNATGGVLTKRLFGWVTPYDKAERFEPFQNNMSQYEAVWFFGSDVGSLIKDGDSWWPENSIFMDLAKRAEKEKVSFGPVLHNSDEKGFNGELALNFLKSSDEILKKIEPLVKKNKWTVLNVDFESLPESSAQDYQEFLKKLKTKFKDLKISVCLHAKISSVGGYEGARFQKWELLKDLDIDFVVMAYDYSWATSKPGLVAPSKWVKAVTEYAIKTFGSDRVTIALPMYGYYWMNKGSKDSWVGTPAITPDLEKRISKLGWKKDQKVSAADGVIYRKGKNEVIAFDNSISFNKKRQMLEKMGIKKIGIWRIGAETELIYNTSSTK